MNWKDLKKKCSESSQEINARIPACRKLIRVIFGVGRDDCENWDFMYVRGVNGVSQRVSG